MAKKRTILFFFFLALTLFIILSPPVLAAATSTEVSYPAIPGLPRITGDSSLPEYIKYWFGFTVYVAAFIALISLAYGGIMYIVSAGSPELISSARDRIVGSLFGLGLLMACFLILRTINPQLTVINMSPLQAVAGLYFERPSDGKLVPFPKGGIGGPGGPSWVRIWADGYTTIRYRCSPQGNGGTCPNSDPLSCPWALIWRYKRLEWNPREGVEVRKIYCGGTINNAFGIGGDTWRSLYWDFETPGIYFFAGPDCGGINVSPFRSTTDQTYAWTSSGKFNENFRNKIRSIYIINEGLPENGGTNYGVILGGTTEGSKCYTPIIWNGNKGCVNIPNNAPDFFATTATGFADIFNWNHDWRSSGSGVVFYSHPFGWVNDRAYFSRIYGREIMENMTPDEIDLPNGNPIGVSCLKFGPRPGDGGGTNCEGSVKVNGNYLVAIYANDNRCQLFRSTNIENFKSQVWVTASRNDIRKIYVITTK